ncbi:MAG: NAD-dependent epimerase/dehydratase family protein, partial [Rhodospirillales bacterium]
ENEPFRYISANLAAQLTILEIALRLKALRHVVYASSSAVYGASPNLPYSLDDRADHPISLYGATKRGGEMMAVAYAAQFGLALTGLRFFTVYGTWGRPDMATWQFTDAIVNGTKLTLFDNGKLSRSFTYVDDIIVGIVAALDLPPALGSTGAGGHKLYNLGNDKSDSVLRYVQVLEQAIGKKAVISLEPRHPADMTDTVSDNSVTERELGWHPRVTIDQGLPKFVEWYRGYTAGKK